MEESLCGLTLQPSLDWRLTVVSRREQLIGHMESLAAQLALLQAVKTSNGRYRPRLVPRL